MKLYGLIFPAIFLVAAGCSDQLSNADPNGYDNSDPLVVVPQDGATGVSPSTDITLAFAQEVDSSIVRTGFHLIAQSAIDDSCEFIVGGRHGTMSEAMMEHGMMDHLDSLHSVDVSIFWGNPGRLATFHPNHPLAPNEQYMIHFDDQMTDMTETLMSRMIGMDGMGTMTNHGFETTPAGIVMHFRTGDK